jgi:hypothetical protein
LVQRDAEAADLKQRLQGAGGGSGKIVFSEPDAEDVIYGKPPIGQREAQGFKVRFYGCQRESGTVKCYFDVTNTKAERKFTLAGYPGDDRYSRAYDDHGQQHTANVPVVSGAGNETTIPDGVTVRASLVFASVPASTNKFVALKFVFDYAYNEYTVDFRDVVVN